MRSVARVCKWPLALLLLVGLLPASAFAQGASITGIVKDTSGAVLPGVTVEASSPALIEKVRSVVSAGDGQYRIVNLVPGVYSVTFTLPGFSTFKRDGVELTGDFTATINGEMKVGAQEETITVTGEAPVVDVQGVQRQRVMTNEVVEAVPTGKYFVNLGVLIPGVSASCSAACQTGTSQDTGGASGDNMSTLIVHGSRFRDQRISINNMTVRGSTGYLGVTGPNIEAQQETQIDTSGADTSVGTGGVRINVVPKDGGNKFAGGLYLSGTNQHFQSKQGSGAGGLDPGLIARGLVATTRVKENHDIAPTFGGPIKQDKLWFFVSLRQNNAQNYGANSFQNANINVNAVCPGPACANAWTYVPDQNTPGFTRDPLPMAGGRLTFQATPRNKFAASFDYRDRCQCNNLGTGGRSPDATQDFRFRPQQIAMLTWSSPVTNKLLLEATAVDLVEGWGNRASDFAANMSQIPVTAQNAPASFLGVTSFRGPGGGNWTWYPYRDLGASATYVTGAHALKLGVEYDWGWNDRWSTSNLGAVVTNIYGQVIPISSYTVSYSTGSPVPNNFSTSLDPTRRNDHAKADGGLYAQDKWTFKRVTLSGGLRYDFFKRVTYAVTEGPTLLQPTRNLVLPYQPVVSYKDLSPRLGMAWDVFGTGKTAVKISLNRYVQDLSLLANAGFSVQNNYQSTESRGWTDDNGNFIPDCDPLNLGTIDNRPTGGDRCAAPSGANANFGLSQPTDLPDPSILGGFNHRGYNWEFSGSLQQELVPHKVALDVAYFRRWYGNFTVTDNPNSVASDYTPFTVTVPAVNPVTGQADLTTAGQTFTYYNADTVAAGTATTNTFFASKIGKQTERWQGVDVSANARLGGGALVQGGFSVGRQEENSCAIVAALPEASVPTVSLTGQPGSLGGVVGGSQFCNNVQNWLWQWKGLGTYTIPKVGIQVSATYQNIPGPQLQATLVVPQGAGSAVATQLGRAATGGSTVTVNMLSPGSVFGDRLTQTDLRVGKVFRFSGNRRATVSVDMFNMFNSHAVLTESSTYPTASTSSPWRVPGLVQASRLLKATLSLNF